jgi:acyl-CoA thioesterase
MSMTVQHCQTNGHDICHGGVIFALADSAFAFACNSYNKVTVAQSNSITFTAPGKTGDRLTADAREVVRSGRSGTYDVTVTNQDGTVIALFRGLSRTISGTLFDEE